MKEELKKMLQNEAPASSYILKNVEIDITFDKFLKSFYYPNFHCLRYLWFEKENKPVHVNMLAFSLYLKILGFINYISGDKSIFLRYNIFDNKDVLVCVESRIHKEELLRFINEHNRSAIVYWIENYEIEKIQKVPLLSPLEVPSSLVSKATIGVDLTYCKYCCYDVFC